MKPDVVVIRLDCGLTGPDYEAHFVTGLRLGPFAHAEQAIAAVEREVGKLTWEVLESEPGLWYGYVPSPATVGA